MNSFFLAQLPSPCILIAFWQAARACNGCIASSSHGSVQSLLLNYHFALLRSGDFILVYYQMGELEYIRYNNCCYVIFHWAPLNAPVTIFCRA